VTAYRLVVFSEGPDAVERRLLRAWRAWPTCGAVLWVISQIVAGAVLSPGAAFATSTIVFLASGLILCTRVIELHSR
jgi:hypothetical protein